VGGTLLAGVSVLRVDRVPPSVAVDKYVAGHDPLLRPQRLEMEGHALDVAFRARVASHAAGATGVVTICAVSEPSAPEPPMKEPPQRAVYEVVTSTATGKLPKTSASGRAASAVIVSPVRMFR